jgi:hypothetical protein
VTTYTPILSLPEVAPNQDQKETTINTALAILEAAMNDTLAVDMSAGDVVLNTDQFTKYFLLQVAPSVAHNLEIPATPRWFAVENQGTAQATVKVHGVAGSTVQLGAGKIGLFVSDGTNVRVVVPDPAAGTGVLADLSDVTGSPTDHQLLRFVAADGQWEPWTLSLAFSGLSDFPGAYGSNAGKLLAVKGDGTGLEYVTSAANVHLFTDLTDAPANYTGAANRTVKVNSAATGLIFAQPKLTEAIDFPSTYSAQAGKFLRVNAGATAVEFHAPVVGDLSDGPGAPAVGSSLMYVRVKLDGSGLEYAAGTGGPDHFYQLADAPSSYAGAAGKLVRVNATANGLIFNTLKFTELSDAPANYTGAAGKFAQVNPGATALIFAQPKVSDLSDGPGAFTSNAKKVVRVNTGATALEYVSLAITDLAGFPSSFTGQGGKFLMVKVDESGVQFCDLVVHHQLPGADRHADELHRPRQPVRDRRPDRHRPDLRTDRTDSKLGHLADVEDGTGTPAQGAFLRWIDGVWQADVFTPGAGTTNVGGLTDGPGAPNSHAGQLVRVNALATALEYFTLPMIPTRLGHLADVEDGTGTPNEGSVLTWKDGVWQAEPPPAGGGSGSALPGNFDVVVSKNGLLFNSQVLATVPITSAVTFADNFAGSVFACKTNPAATTVLAVMRNGTQIGSVSISTAGVATFSTIATGTESFVAGDILRIDGPTSADATLADFGFTLKGTRVP